MSFDIFACLAQGTAFVAWAMVEEKPILYATGVACLLVSIGWWQNFVSEKSPIPFLRNLGLAKKEFSNKTYFSYLLIAPIKCIVFVITASLIIWMQEGNLSVMYDYFVNIFDSHKIVVREVRKNCYFSVTNKST